MREAGVEDPEIVIARNAHPNELSAFGLAGDVHSRLVDRGYDTALETRTVYPLSAYIVQKDRSGLDFDTALENIRGCGKWEGNVEDKYPDSRVFHFHNYPINQGPDETILVDPEDWKEVNLREPVDLRGVENPYQGLEFLVGYYNKFEIPAVYEKEPHPEVISAMQDANPRNTLEHLSGDLLPVDRQASREHGFLDSEVPEIIIDQGIEEILSTEPML